MEQKILQFTRREKTYLKLAEERAERGDFTGALGFLFSAKDLEETPEVLSAIADVYSEMGALELSNKYWFKYIDKVQEDKLAVAYEELAINLFYMENYLASSFYFHKKLMMDGYISKEGIDQEIIEFFSGEEYRKNSYYLAYPFDKADYSYTAKRAKRALAGGGFDEAISLINSIPIPCRNEEVLGDLTIAHLMNEQYDEAADVARSSLAMHGDNVTAFCNLSTVYDMKEDKDKSEYYYKKALEYRKGEENEEYRIATCAIEREDHSTVKACLQKIVEERPYDVVMRFFYGISLINLGEYPSASEELLKVYKTDPYDMVFEYYAKLALGLKDGRVKELSFNKIRYMKLLPEQVEKEYKKMISDLTANPQKACSAIKKPNVIKVLEYVLRSADKDVARQAVYLLSTVYSPQARELLKQALSDNEVQTGVKRVILYAMVINGCKENLSIVDRNFYFKCKAKKVACEKDKDAGLFLSAYALCFSRMVFYGVEDLDKIASSANKVYSKLKDVITEAEVSNDELAGLILSIAGIEKLSGDNEVCGIFDIEKKKLGLLKSIYKGEKK